MDEWHADDQSELPEALAARIKPELMPGERLIWAASSRPVRRKPWADLVFGIACCFGAIGIGVVCFAASAGWIGGRFGRKLAESDTTFAVLGVIFCIIGFVGFFGGLHQGIGNLRRGETSAGPAYALTDRRAIIWKPRWAEDAVEVFSYARGSIRSVHRVEFPGGEGSVVFQLAEPFTFGVPSGFIGIEEVRRVEEYVRQSFLLDPAV